VKESSANIMRQNKRVIRAISEPCDASCATWFACANSKPNGVCSGFVLMNGQTRKHLDKILNEDDAIYVQNCVRMIQNGDMSEDKESLVEEVLRFIPEVERQPKETGFAAMLTAARSGTPTSEHTAPEEERATSGFSAMLSASSKGKKTDEETVKRALDEIEADEKKYRRQPSTPIKRRMGFTNMLEASQTGTFEGEEEFKRDRDSISSIPSGFQRRGAGFGAMLEAARPSRVIEIRGFSSGNATGQSVETEYDVKPIPCGLAAMLDAMSPNRTRETLDEKPHVRRGMGFANMLRGAAEGTE